MMLWLLFAALTVVTIAVLVFPLLRKSTKPAHARVEYDVVVYRDQLAEIAQEIESGLLTPAQADAARAEVHRRMLAAEDAELKTPAKPARTESRYARLAVIIAIALVLPVGAALMYGALGSPHLPGKPFAWREKNDPEFTAAAGAKDLAAQLQKSPSVAGYQQLAVMYLTARQYEQSAAADRRAIDLGATDAATWSDLGEAEVLANDGAVGADALQAFTNALSAEPRSERARFYIGLAEAQIGKLKQAVGIWRDLEKDSAADAPWLPMLREHIAVYAKQGGFDPASAPPSPPSVETMNASIAAMKAAAHMQGGAAPAAPAAPSFGPGR
jgi:cytochrome c-type biogenesis protein CcmH